MKFKAVPVTDLLDATLNFEQLQGRDILDRTQATILNAPTGTMVSRTRLMGTVYQPNTTRPTFVLVTFQGNVTNSTAAATVKCDAANPPTIQIADVRVTSADASQVLNDIPVSFICPAGFFYLFSTTGATAATVVSTFEYTL